MNGEDMKEAPDAKTPGEEELKQERYELLQRLEGWLETPMLVLAFVWLVLLIVELVRRESELFYFLGTTIWVVFIIDFAVKLVLAPDCGLRLVSSLNRGMKALGASLSRRGFGYVIALTVLATFFVGRDAESNDAEVAGARQLTALQEEVSALRAEIRALSQQLPES